MRHCIPEASRNECVTVFDKLRHDSQALSTTKKQFCILSLSFLCVCAKTLADRIKRRWRFWSIESCARGSLLAKEEAGIHAAIVNPSSAVIGLRPCSHKWKLSPTINALVVTFFVDLHKVVESQNKTWKKRRKKVWNGRNGGWQVFLERMRKIRRRSSNRRAGSNLKG